MPLPKELTTVTKVSKTLALLLFIALPIMAFYIGKNYQSSLDLAVQQSTQQVYQPLQTVVKAKIVPGDLKQDFLDVKEWGVKLPITEESKGLYYSVNTPSVYAFRSAKLDEISGSCKSNSISIQRGVASDKLVGEISLSRGLTLEENYKSGVGQETDAQTTRSINIKIGQHYYATPGYAGASCGSTSQQQQETNAMMAIVKAVRKMQQY